MRNQLTVKARSLDWGEFQSLCGLMKELLIDDLMDNELGKRMGIFMGLQSTVNRLIDKSPDYFLTDQFFKAVRHFITDKRFYDLLETMEEYVSEGKRTEQEYITTANNLKMFKEIYDWVFELEDTDVICDVVELDEGLYFLFINEEDMKNPDAMKAFEETKNTIRQNLLLHV